MARPLWVATDLPTGWSQARECKVTPHGALGADKNGHGCKGKYDGKNAVPVSTRNKRIAYVWDS